MNKFTKIAILAFTSIICMVYIFFNIVKIFFCGTNINKIQIEDTYQVDIILQQRFCIPDQFINYIYLVEKDDKLGIFDEPIFSGDDNLISFKWLSKNKLQIDINDSQGYKYEPYAYINNQRYEIVVKRVEKEEVK